MKPTALLSPLLSPLVRGLLALGLLTFCQPLRTASAVSAPFGESAPVAPSLVLDSAAIAPGKSFTAGILLKMAPGWHTYWQFGGDSGAPTKIEWTLPAGFSAGKIQWPTPKARLEEGDLLSYVYEDEVLLQVEIRAPEKLPSGNITLKAEINWLACKESCVPGTGTVSIKVPGQPAPAPANADIFKLWRTRLPQAGPPPFTVKWELADKEVVLKITGLAPETKLEFFPIPPAAEFELEHTKSGTSAEGARTLSIAVKGSGAAKATWTGVLAIEKPGSPREAWLVSSKD